MLAPSATAAPSAFGFEPGDCVNRYEHANLERARQYLAAIEAGDRDRALAFYHPEVVQEELPNRLVPAGATRDLAALRDASVRGAQVMSVQRYEIRRAYAVADSVILEVLWVGTVAVPVGTLAVGHEMRAHFAVFLDFVDGRIYRQRNYDCFEAF